MVMSGMKLAAGDYDVLIADAMDTARDEDTDWPLLSTRPKSDAPTGWMSIGVLTPETLAFHYAQTQVKRKSGGRTTTRAWIKTDEEFGFNASLEDFDANFFEVIFGVEDANNKVALSGSANRALAAVIRGSTSPETGTGDNGFQIRFPRGVLQVSSIDRQLDVNTGPAPIMFRTEDGPDAHHVEVAYEA